MGWIPDVGGLHARYEEAEGFHLYMPVCETVSETACSD